jgi:GDPmannose 4,6-dehydratase
MWQPCGRCCNATHADDFVVGTGESHSIRELLDAAFGYVNLDWNDYVRIDPRYFRPTEVDYLQADPSKARLRS